VCRVVLSEVAVLCPPVERAESVDHCPDAASRHRGREVVHKLLYVTAANVRHAPATEARLDMDPQHLVEVVHRARLVAAAALVERSPLARRRDEFLARLAEAEATRLHGCLAAVEARLQICARVARSFGCSEAAGADGSSLGAVIDLAPIGGLTSAALAALLQVAALLMAGEHALVAGA
jgi:hypothetical protein